MYAWDPKKDPSEPWTDEDTAEVRDKLSKVSFFLGLVGYGLDIWLRRKKDGNR